MTKPTKSQLRMKFILKGMRIEDRLCCSESMNVQLIVVDISLVGV